MLWVVVNEPPRIIAQSRDFNSFKSSIQARYTIEQEFSVFMILPEVNILLENDGDLQSIRQLEGISYFKWILDDLDNLEDGADQEDEHSDEQAEEGININATIVAADLSLFQNTSIPSCGARWDEVEKSYLKNFHRYLVKLQKKLKKDVKPDHDCLRQWLTRRKTNQEALFGHRSSSAIISMYNKMKKCGDFSNL